jgi:VWFA-related protein
MSERMRAPIAALLPLCLATLLSYGQETAPSPTPANAAQSAPASQGAGTNPETAYKSSTVLKYTTRLVVVDVIATDHKGNPVNNLEKQDFTLLEDGKDQNIEVFSLQAPGEGNRAAGARVLPKLPPNIISNVPRYDVTRTLTVLLLDGLNTQTSNQAFARDQMLKFLEKLPTDQPIAVFALGTKLRLLQDFTSDPALLKNAVMAMQSHGSPLLNNPAGAGGDNGPLPAGFMAAVAETAPALAAQMQQFEQDSTTMQTDMRVQLTLAAFNALARALAGYPGRKNLIWLSQSFPLSILATAIASGNVPTPAVPNQRTEMNNRDYSMENARTASLLTDAQVAVYPVDVGALVGNQVYSSLSNTDENGNYLGRTMSGRSAGGMLAADDELNRTSVEQLGAHSSMNDLADRTGGKAYYNRNDVDAAIQKTLDDGSTYYTLAYHPQNKDWNGKFRKISLKVRQSGIKLRYRAGYYAVDPQSFEKMTQQRRNAEFGQALNLDFPISTAVPFQARVFAPSEQTKGKVVINYGIDPHAILFESEADGQHAEVDYAVAVYSKKGEALKLEGHTLKTALPPDAFQKVMSSYLPCQLQFELPPGEYVLRLGVRDDRTGLLGTVNTAVTVPHPAR